MQGHPLEPVPAGTSATSASPTASSCPARNSSLRRGSPCTADPPPVRRFLPQLVQLIEDKAIDPGKVFDLSLPLDQAAEGYRAMDERRAHQGAATPLTPDP